VSWDDGTVTIITITIPCVPSIRASDDHAQVLPPGWGGSNVYPRGGRMSKESTCCGASNCSSSAASTVHDSALTFELGVVADDEEVDDVAGEVELLVLLVVDFGVDLLHEESSTTAKLSSNNRHHILIRNIDVSCIAIR
jgi:hypothetical protein